MNQPPLRLAVVSSPRSGNTWLRHLLGDALGVSHTAVHHLDDLEEIPTQFVVQVHLYPEPSTLNYFRSLGFQTVSISRHPLDILISAARFAQFEPEVKRWVDGMAGAEVLNGVDPTSDTFRSYALSGHFRHLLGVTKAWLASPFLDATVRYEDLVAHPAGELSALFDRLEQIPSPTVPQLEEAVRRNGLGRLAAAANRHGWKGQTGNWVQYVDRQLATEFFALNSDFFDRDGYTIDAAQELDPRDVFWLWEAETA